MSEGTHLQRYTNLITFDPHPRARWVVDCRVCIYILRCVIRSQTLAAKVSSSDRDNSVDALVVLASTDCREIPILEVRAPSGKSVFEAPAFSWRSLIVLDLKPITEEVESGVGPIVGLEILPWINRILDLRTRLSLAILKTR